MLDGVWLWVGEVEVGVVPVVLLVAELRTDAVVVGEVAVVSVVERLRTGDVASAELELLTPSRIQLDAVPQLLPAAHQPA
jgi:hypothetical protein